MLILKEVPSRMSIAHHLYFQILFDISIDSFSTSTIVRNILVDIFQNYIDIFDEERKIM